MPNPQSAGIYTQENRSGIPTITGAATSVGGFSGRANRGRPSTSLQVVSEVDYVAKYGKTQNHLRAAIRAFFNEGGSACRVSRVEHYTDLADRSTLAGTAASAILSNGSSTTLTFNVNWPGSEGNLYTITTQRKATVVAQLAVATTAGAATSMVLDSARRVRVGDQLLVGTDRVVVTRIVGNTVYFASTVLTVNALAANVTSETFDVDITEDGVFVERGRDLRMSPLAGRTYVGTVFYDTGPTRTFSVTNANLVAASAVDPRPADGTTNFSAGADGGGIVDADFVGNKAGKTGLYAFKETEINMISIPGEATATISRGLLAFVDNYKTVTAILDTPEATAVYSEAVTYVTTTANLAHDNAVIYYPWLKETDPDTGLLTEVSPCGFMQGVWARVDRLQSIAEAPAGTKAALRTALGVAEEIEEKTAEADALYSARINPIIVAPEGILLGEVAPLASLTSLDRSLRVAS